MNSNLLRAAAGLALLLVADSAAWAQTATPRWHSKLERGAELARVSGKPLFVVFRCVR